MEWRTVIGHPRYEISRNGQVRAVAHTTTYIREGKHTAMRRKTQLRKLTLSRQGYWTVGLRTDGRYHTVLIHRALAMAFIGPPPFDGAVVRHLNDISDDNRLENLAWGTHKQNSDDQIRNGKHAWVGLTACRSGHEYTPENTYYRLDGKGRLCRECSRRRDRERHARKMAARPDACRRGHPRTSETSRVLPDGRRQCRVCTRQTERERYARQKAKVAG